MRQGGAVSKQLEFLGTNPILRYLLDDHPDHSLRSKALIESGRRFRVSVVTLAEVGYVLTRAARVPRSDAVDAMVELLGRENIEVHEITTELAIEALFLCRPSGRVNFADALLWGVARNSESRVWTFDERFPLGGIDLRSP